MMRSATTSYSSESNSDQERSVNEYLRVVQSQHVYGNMHAFSSLPQIPGHSFYFPSPFYAGPPQGAYHPSFPGLAYGHVTPPNVFTILPNVPIILPHFPLISPQITGAAMYYPFPFQPVLPQIMYQPSFSVGHMPQLNDPRMSSIAPYIPFPLYNVQPQIAYQPPVEPALNLISNSSSNYVEQAQSTSQPPFDPTFDEGQQPHNSTAPPQVQSEGLVPASNIYPSSSNCIEQPQSAYQLSPDPTFDEGEQSHDSTLPSQVQSAELALTRNIDPFSFCYHEQPQNTYQPSFDAAFFGEQMYDDSILYQVLGAGIEHEYAPQGLKNDMGPTSEVYPSYPANHSEEPQSTYLSSFQPPSNYPPESSVSEVLNSVLGSINEDHSFSANDRGSLSCELLNLLSVPELDFQQITSSQEMTPSSKRNADEIYPSGSELDISGQSATAPSFEDAPRPRKRLKEADIDSTPDVPEEMMQSLAATADYHDSHSPKTFPVDGCRISHEQHMDLPVQSERSIDRHETQNDTVMLHGAHNIRISGNPTFANIGVNNVTKNSGAHDLEILTKFVSFDAIHDSSVQDPDRRCHPGTRANALARLQGWMDVPSSERIIWFHGLPGAGKSSIAQTTIRKCGKEKVVATFFFYRSDPSRNDGNRLFTTIAWQLASSISGVKSHLVDSLTHRPDLPMKDIETQFEELVVQPFHGLNDAASHPELPPAPVVVIDGIDECTDEKLQRRILNVIGNAIRDRRVPLRFLILSRPETHIKEIVDQFECPTLCIDLDSIDNANHDIERYLNAEFFRIACERKFDTTWPGHRVIQNLVCNSSGQFVYAATVMKYVGDEFNCAKSQLDIILGLGKRPSTSPFAPLDELYTEILKRQPDQDFLKDILALLVLVARGSIGTENHADFPMLLSVSEEEMRRKLRGMRSLLAFEEGDIDIHHRSFLDFLQDASRSGQYHISQRASLMRFLELIIDAIVPYVSDVIDQPQCRDTQHLHLQYSSISDSWPLYPRLAVEDLKEVLQPLMDLQDKHLKPNFTPPCNKCDAFKIMRNLLLHLALSQAESYCIASASRATESLKFEQNRDHSTIAALPKIEAENNVSEKDLDTDFASLLAYMRNTPSTSSPTVSVLELMYSLLRFDYVDIAKKVCSVLDAQNLMNLIDYIIHDQNIVKNGGSLILTCKAIRLVREIFARVPVLPQSLILHEDALNADEYMAEYDSNDSIEDFCRKALMGMVHNCHFISASTNVLILHKNGQLFSTWLNWHVDIDEWLRPPIPSASRSVIFQVIMESSKSIQYFHSVGIVLSRRIELFVGPELRPKLTMLPVDWNIKEVKLEKYAYENSIFAFGRLFYETYFNMKVPYYERTKLQRDIIVKRPSEPEIREDAWQLIQRCCAEDPESRPTIDEVVQEMESWDIESEIAMPASSSSVDWDFWLAEAPPPAVL